MEGGGLTMLVHLNAITRVAHFKSGNKVRAALAHALVVSRETRSRVEDDAVYTSALEYNTRSTPSAAAGNETRVGGELTKQAGLLGSPGAVVEDAGAGVVEVGPWEAIVVGPTAGTVVRGTVVDWYVVLTETLVVATTAMAAWLGGQNALASAWYGMGG